MKRVEWLFPVLLVGLLLAGYGLVPVPKGREGATSFSVDGGGRKAFFDLASRLLPGVSRSAGSLVPTDPDVDILVLLGPARYPDRGQWQRLHDWVSEGRGLLFAAKWQDPVVELGPFGIRVVPRGGARTEDSEDAEEPELAEAEEETFIESELSSGQIEWKSFGRVESDDPEAYVQLSMSGEPQVISQAVGDGLIVVAASDFIFSNLSLTKPDNGIVAFRILESTYPAGRVLFDEGLNEAGAPKVVGVLFEEPFRLPTVQLLVVTLLFAWMSSRRFGPLWRPLRVERRSLVEHAQALGGLHFRAGTGPRLIAAYLEHFRRELGLKRGGSAASGSDVVARALRATKSPTLERDRMAALVTSLARFRQERTGIPSKGD
jgi:hypothetical protein